MKTSSKKAKGSRLQKWVANQISRVTGYACGKDKHIASRESSQPGTDIRLVGEVREDFPFSIECKNQETWNIHDWIKQAQDNQEPNMDWMLIASRNRCKKYVIMDALEFFAYWKDYLAYCNKHLQKPSKDYL